MSDGLVEEVVDEDTFDELVTFEGMVASASTPKKPDNKVVIDENPVNNVPNGVELRPGMSALKVVNILVPCCMSASISFAVGPFSVSNSDGDVPGSGGGPSESQKLPVELDDTIVGETGSTITKSPSGTMTVPPPPVLLLIYFSGVGVIERGIQNP